MNPKTALIKIKYCMGCERPTTGSIGIVSGTGTYWSRVCQPCKDEADDALAARLSHQAKALDFISDALFGPKPQPRVPVVSHANN